MPGFEPHHSGSLHTPTYGGVHGKFRGQVGGKGISKCLLAWNSESLDVEYLLHN